uniref:Retrovirus-related Pol polyprotein from transposon TNT 1-94 n=1 Tax=Tanacetum cinerariifolium TaxID=118510 RepID=A0A699HZB0_TANCI|nr:retrovirus-related Pol polyprotein from transposon TNT 1-94 [Tanacetum cinerariifolium]
MVCTRPDIVFDVSIVSDVDLVYRRDQRKHVDVDGFVDASYAKELDNGGSITGVMVLTEAVNESIWRKSLRIELGVNLRLVVVNCDYFGAIHLSRNPMFYERTKYINVRYHSIIEIVDSKEIAVAKTRTKDNTFDAFTKVVLAPKFKYYMEILGVDK